MKTKSINTIRIFLASSNELKDDREQFAAFIMRLNMHYESRGYRFILNIWEFLDPAYDDQRKQDEYNTSIKDCDFFVALLHTKAGKFTIDELNAAREEHEKRKLPMFIYFRDLDYWQALQKKDENLEALKKSIGDDTNLFWGSYNNIDNLHLDFVLWLDNKLEQDSAIEVKGDEVIIGDLPLARFSQLPFAANNSEYQRLDEQLANLEQDIEQIRQNIKEYPNDEYFSARLSQKVIARDKLMQEVREQQDAMLGAAKRIAEMRKQQISNKLAKAVEAFENGQLNMANTYFDELQGDQLFEDIKSKYEQTREQLHNHIDALLLQTQTVMADSNFPIEKRITRVADIYAKADKWASASNYNDEKYAKLLLDYAQFLSKYAQYSDAEHIYLRHISIAELLFGKDSPNVADAYNHIGKVYYNQGKYKSAFDYFVKAQSIYEKNLGPNNLHTAKSYNNIGLIYDEQGNYEKALEYYNKALEIREKVLGKEHPDTAKSYNNIGAVYFSIGDYGIALEYLFKAIDIIKHNLGEDHPNTAITYNNIGLVYKVQGNKDKALEFYFKAVDILEQVLGEKHPFTASSYNNVGGIYYSLGDYERASEYYKKALNIRIQILGVDHPDTATSYNNLGVLYLELGIFNEALECYKSALTSREKILGKNHINTAQSYNNMGIICYRQGKYNKALDYYNQALDVFTKKLGEDHPQTAVVYNNIGEVYSNKGDIDRARFFYSKSIPIIEKKLGVENTIDTSNQNNNILKQSYFLDQNIFKIINDITKCTAALNDVNFDFNKELQTLAKDLRTIFKSEYCAIGIVNENMAEDYIVSLEPHREERMQKLQTDILESVKAVDTSNNNILLCRALDQKSQDIVTFEQPEVNESKTFGQYKNFIMKSGNVVNITVIPIRDKLKDNIGFIQFLNSEERIDFNIISPLMTSFLGLANALLQRNKQRIDKHTNDLNFYDIIQKAKGANDLLDEIMKYLATEFNAAIVSFRIPISNAPQKKLSHFYLRSCYVNGKIKNHNRIKEYYYKDRVLIQKKRMGGYHGLRSVHRGQIIYDKVNNTWLKELFHLDLHEKSIIIPIFRNNSINRSFIKQLYGSFQLRFLKPSISSTDKNSELLSQMLFERDLKDAKKRLEELSEQITLLFNSYEQRFENDSLQIFQDELKNSSFVKIQDFDERCVHIIKKSVRANVCSIYRYNNTKKQLSLSATTAQSILFKKSSEIINRNSSSDRCFIPIPSKKNILAKAFEAKLPMYIYDIRDPKAHYSSFIENLDGNNYSAMVVPMLKKNGECSGVVLLMGKKEPNRFISTTYWEHDINHIEFIVSTLTRISESDNERMTFLSQLSHELLSPVTELVYDNDYIITLAETYPDRVAKQQLISKLRENIDMCMLLKYIITDTEFRYAASGRKMDYNIVQQDKPQEILLDAIHLLEKEAIDKEVTFEKNFSNMPSMYFDKERLMQVFLNLIKNAIRYSYESTTINISYQLRNNQHEITFANYGIGIQDEEKEKIFDLFYRSEEAKIKSDSGTGIGLYIVRDIMRDHGGDCFVRNLKDPTEFVITLPKKNN